MNKPRSKTQLTPHPIALAMFPTQQPMRRETTLRTTSCLSSRPPLPRTPAEVLRQVFDRWPEFSTVAGTALNAARPGHREHPVRREPDPQSQPPIPETQREKPIPREPSPGPLRNGNPRGNPNLAPRCGAKTRQGCPCKGPAMKNGKCRMHGGAATGPKTAEGKARIAAAHATGNPAYRALKARTDALRARGRVLFCIAKTGFALEALNPLLHQIRPDTRQSPYAVSPALLSATDLKSTEATALIALIQAASAPAAIIPGKWPAPTVIPGEMAAPRPPTGPMANPTRHPRACPGDQSRQRRKPWSPGQARG